MKTLADKFGFNRRVFLEEIEEKHIGIVKQIKSRIIQKDARKIIKMAEIIHKSDPSLKVSLICNNNICSKSLALLDENEIDVIFK